MRVTQFACLDSLLIRRTRNSPWTAVDLLKVCPSPVDQVLDNRVSWWFSAFWVDLSSTLSPFRKPRFLDCPPAEVSGLFVVVIGSKRSSPWVSTKISFIDVAQPRALSITGFAATLSSIGRMSTASSVRTWRLLGG